MWKVAFLTIAFAVSAGSAAAADCPADPKRMTSPLDTQGGHFAQSDEPKLDRDTLTQHATLPDGQRLIYSADVFGEDQGDGTCLTIEESSFKLLGVQLKDKARNARLLEAIRLMRASPTKQLPAAKAKMVFEVTMELLDKVPMVAGSPQKASLQSGLQAALEETPALDAGSFFLHCKDSRPMQCLLWSHADETDGPGPTLAIGMQRVLK